MLTYPLPVIPCQKGTVLIPPVVTPPSIFSCSLPVMNHPGGPQSGMAEMESGLSLLGRLTERPALEHLLGAARGAPPSQLTAVVTRSPAGDSGAALAASFYLKVICNVILPTSHRGVQLFGCGAGLGR
jgi:hypothetical protein